MTDKTDLSWRLNKRYFKFFAISPQNNECPPYTGFIANTHGFHCRTAGKIGSCRKQLHFRIKKDPFNNIFVK